MDSQKHIYEYVSSSGSHRVCTIRLSVAGYSSSGSYRVYTIRRDLSPNIDKRRQWDNETRSNVAAQIGRQKKPNLLPVKNTDKTECTTGVGAYRCVSSGHDVTWRIAVLRDVHR